MQLETLLRNTPVGQWATRLAIIFDWYDGPREGICSLSRPGVEFYFELLDERFNPDGLDDRLLRLSELPSGSVAETQSVLSVLGSPTHCYWVPIWRFPDEAARERGERQVQAVRAARRPTDLVICTQDMEHFLGLWTVPRTEPDRKDWFAFLGIPAVDSADSPHGQVA